MPLHLLDVTIPTPDPNVAAAARTRIDQLTKPLGSLGRLEDLAVRLCAIHGSLKPPTYRRRAVLIGAGDHGVTEAGVSAYPKEVTAQMVGGFLGGTAAICALSRAAQAEVSVVNFGVDAVFAPHPRLIDLGVARGTANFAEGPAMSVEQAHQALQAGMTALALLDPDETLELLALGEMGIGNTTSAAAIICALTGRSAVAVVGRGTGIDDTTLEKKIGVVDAAVQRLGGSRSWEAIASEVGGFEIVGLAGALLAAAQRRIPVVLDGFIVAAAALLAQAIAPASVAYCIASHRSQELGHLLALEALGLEPLFDLNLRLGEASGAALAMPLIEAASRMCGEMKTFSEAGVSTAEQA